MFLGCMFLTNKCLLTFVLSSMTKGSLKAPQRDIWDKNNLFQKKMGVYVFD